MDPEQEAKLKAEARAYALSSSSSSKGSKRKLPSSISSARTKNTASIAGVHKPTSLNIHRPQKIQKVNQTFASSNVAAITPTVQPHTYVFDENDDDYERFVKSLGLDDSLFATFDDDEEFHLSDIDEEDDDDDDDDENEDSVDNAGCQTKPSVTVESTPTLSSPLSSSPITLAHLDETDEYRSLEEELGSLLEEDMEAAVQSLMTSKKPVVSSPDSGQISATSPKTPKTNGKKQSKASIDAKNVSPATPLRETARHGTKTQVTYRQSQQLRRLLTSHYQLLVQQAVLAVRAAQMQKIYKEKSDFLSGETADDLAEILDGAVGMLQDLDQNRKDAIRNSIQLTPARCASRNPLKGRRSLLSKFKESSDNGDNDDLADSDRRLTRAAFSKTLEQNKVVGMKRTAFDIPGLMKLKETFATIDKSVEGVKGVCNILESPTHTEACKSILRQAAANVDESYIPGVNDLSENFCDAKEIFGEDFRPPCSEDQQIFLRRNRNLFSSGEDNLVLRGVNLYGEKQWILIADRYLPDRSINIISQRYSKLCVMLYRAHGIYIDGKGNLEEPPKLESVDDIDESRVKELELATVEPPAILNVHRWSLEEDLTLLKAVPIMGHMWAELGARLIPHRDRGHLRKRYQVLERRVKATVARNAKADYVGLKIPKQQASRKGDSPEALTKQLAKPTASGRSADKKVAVRKSSAPDSKATLMSIEKAAASLAFLRPSSSQVPNLTSKDDKDAIPLPQKQSAATLSPKGPPLLRSLPLLDDSRGIDGSVPSLHARMDMHLIDPTSSRAAFERLVEGTSDEWSQMSRMKHMMDSDGESRAADAIVNQLARSPDRRSAARLPQIHLDSNSMSGLSILQSDAVNQTSEIQVKFGPETSIMSRILGETTRNCDRRDQKHDTNIKWPTLEGSPRKPTLSNITKPATPAQPSTPKRTNFFSESGTPMGLSPGFRPSPGISRNGSSITLTPNPTYSPAPSAVMRLMSEPSGDELRFCDFQISEESRKGLEGDNYQVHQAHDPTPPPLTPSKNSLMLEEFDAIEAISALNSLSNSPFRVHKKNRESDTFVPQDGKKSLFASVVGGIKEKDPKARLQF